MEAKVGRKGFVRVKGDLPMVSQPRKGLEKLRSGRRKNAIIVEAQALELRLRNSYTGTSNATRAVLCFFGLKHYLDAAPPWNENEV